ncbi:hypothetical protein [Flammeovirga sp. EKP202]|uniref:hypothetical protein n=1 Tax=Flammeovirga sp. EKP202 TaxID=2770592 RepID=UPI00165F5E2D|nr:hypothetical protein [Flammeovirga sp. EKP202]MBD0401479.1 hypothetical protein [Flammeovirga sp. EKP202]
MEIQNKYNPEDKEYQYYFDGNNIEESIYHFNKNKIKNVILSPNYGFKEDTFEISLLLKLKYMEKLYIPIFDTSNIEAIGKLIHLKELRIHTFSKKQKINLSPLTNLKKFKLSCYYTTKIIGLENLINLEELTLYNTKSDILNEQTFYYLTKLKRIELVRPKFENTKFLSKLNKLQCIYFHQVASKSPIDIGDFCSSKNTLIHLKLQLCRNIVGFESLKELKQLIRLQIIDSSVVPSAYFVKELPNLTTLTVIRKSYFEDGNLDDLRNIEYVIVDNKKHYNIKAKELKADHFPPPIPCCQ